MRNTIDWCPITKPIAIAPFPDMPQKNRLHASFLNSEFLLCRDGRAVRILAEFLEPEHRFERFKINDTIVFFGSARIPPRRVADTSFRLAGHKAGPISTVVVVSRQEQILFRYYEECSQLSKRI